MLIQSANITLDGVYTYTLMHSCLYYELVLFPSNIILLLPHIRTRQRHVLYLSVYATA